ncbi:MAG: protein translocase subunit SecF [Rhodospirillaceae bacterium]|nr:protein translocase subunit SecF [Rhodospirillaceae bacterium]
MIIQPLMRYVLREFTFDFVGARGYATMFSAVLIVGSLLSLGTLGLNFGIDFAGGVLIEARAPQAVELAPIRAKVNDLDLGDVSISTIGNEGRDITIRVQRQEGGDAAQSEALNKVQAALGDGYEIRRTEVVGPKVGGELVVKGAMAIALALIGIAIYVWIRFEWQYALGALLSLTHDVISILGIFSLFQIQFDLNSVAAILTITGISINDTVVVYDRVREMLRKYKKLPLPDLLNLAINKVLARTLVTNVTVLLGVLALLFGGGDVLWGFSLALLWGVLIGSYSTVYAALPILVYFDLRPDDMMTAKRPAGQVPEYERAPNTP